MNSFSIGLVVGAISALLFVVVINPDKTWHDRIIKHECGQYNPQTGNFEWIINKVEEK